ncbi:glucoamylase family protein [Angustibacter sp. McL0619]|uniref:glucoamylase family protein n=1 Tax=Angustibacter sp. McL0619 TaxID=3415676 RepID=UPI003CE73C35
MHRRTALLTVVGPVLLALLAGSSAAATAAPPGRPDGGGLTSADRATLHRYAADTWRSFVALTDDATGLPADNMTGPVTAPVRSGYTSPTNIGGYLWSTVVARDTGVIRRAEALRRMSRTLTTLGHLDRHPASGMFYNWYDEHTGAKLTVWPPSGDPITPFLSSVDNGWLAAALMVVAGAEPRLRRQAQDLLRPMDFGFFYNPAPARDGVNAGFVRGGFWDSDPGGCSVVGNYRGSGPDVWYTCNSYDTTVTEARIALYLGIARAQIPPEAYYATWRTFPSTCDWSWQEQQPVGTTRTYLGVPVYEGAYRYRGMRLVPSWGGDMFESLMPDLFVPEASWGPRSWAVNHPLTVRAQIEHGLDDAKYGYWGFSPSSTPGGGYREYGVDAIGMNPDGYYSDAEKSPVDDGFGDCRPATVPTPTFGDGVVTPHASFLALPYAPRAAMDNLAAIKDHLGAYGDGGFYDAVAVRSGTVAKTYLSLDQAMVMGAIGNVLTGSLHQAFVTPDVEHRLRPLLARETFSAGMDG